MRRAVLAFWSWYGRHYTLNLTIAATLFALQIVHLVWLGGEVVAERAFGDPLFHIGGPAKYLLVLVDWTEIPAIVSVTVVYLYELRQRFRWRTVGLLGVLNVQYLHIFWITDSLVVRDTAQSSALPNWLAWVAIMIDYLELPVIFDTSRRVIRALRRHGVKVLVHEYPDVSEAARRAA